MIKTICSILIFLTILSFILTVIVLGFFYIFIPGIFKDIIPLELYLSILAVLLLLLFLAFFLSSPLTTLRVIWYLIKPIPFIKWNEHVTNYLHKRLDKLFVKLKSTNPVINNDKYILFSDCHRGDNSWADDFAQNENVFFHALGYYYLEGYTYIEVGDGDELWENKYPKVRKQQSHIFWLLDKFHKEGRLFMIWGNHDRYKFKKGISYSYLDDKINDTVHLFKNAQVYEGLVMNLKDKKMNMELLLLHGHQVDMFNGFYFNLGKFATKTLWRSLQLAGISDTTSPAQNYKKRDTIDNRLIDWTKKKNNTAVIAGHNHHPRLRLDEKGVPYFNTGSCVHPRCITGIELFNDKDLWYVSLVKWYVTTELLEKYLDDQKPGYKKLTIKKSGTTSKLDPELFVYKEIKAGPIPLYQFLSKTETD